MPELPEVETVKRGLERLLGSRPDEIQKIRLSPFPLRVSPDPKLLKRLEGERLLGVQRQAKYLLFKLESHQILSHLGMTGSWRLLDEPRKHDHVQIFLKSGRCLVFNDPRRFGMFEVLKTQEVETSPRLCRLGRDPVDKPYLNGEELYTLTRNRKAPIKSLIMNQALVVGVGNIYASEALYLSGIHPLAPAESLTAKECESLALAIVRVLRDAIEMGGTTVSDFRQAGGSAGYFQNFLLAYGRGGEPCVVCETPLVNQVIAGRSSFWCPQCQSRDL